MDRWAAAGGEMDDERVKELLEQCSDENLLKLSTNTHAIAMPTSRSDSSILSISSSDDRAIDTDLLARFNRLKAPPPTPRVKPLPDSSSSSPCAPAATAAAPVPPLDPAEVDILGSHLAARLAVLKLPASLLSKGKNPSSQSGITSVNENSISDTLNPSTSEPAHIIEHERQTRSSFGVVLDASTETIHDSEVRKLLSLVSDQIKLGRTDDWNRTGKKARDAENSNSEEEISDRDVDQMVEWAKDAARLDNRESDDDDDDDDGGDGSGGQGEPVEGSDADEGEAGLGHSAKPVSTLYKKSKRTSHRLKWW